MSERPFNRFVDDIGPPLRQIEEDYSPKTQPGHDVRALIREIYRLDAKLAAEQALANKYKNLLKAARGCVDFVGAVGLRDEIDSALGRPKGGS